MSPNDTSIIQEILKSYDVDLEKIECYKQSDANDQTTKVE